MVKALPRALLNSRQLNVKLLRLACLGMESIKPRHSTALRGWCWSQTLACKPRYSRPRGDRGYKWLVKNAQTKYEGCCIFSSSDPKAHKVRLTHFFETSNLVVSPILENWTRSFLILRGVWCAVLFLCYFSRNYIRMVCTVSLGPQYEIMGYIVICKGQRMNVFISKEVVNLCQVS